ncbi:MAG: SIMPL domain-containing protein [Byssovorax sp.]
MNKHSFQGKLDLFGEGQVKVKPDVATVALSVVTEGKTAEEAVSTNARKASEVIEKMMRLEIPRDAMRTTGLNVYPIYQTNPQTNESQVVGFRAQDSLSVEAPVAMAGKVFDVGIGAGANESSGISFGIKNEKPYREQALDLAIKNAKAEAEAVCKAMGVTLIGPININVVQGSGPVRVLSERLMKAETPVLPGQQLISASVQVTFEYRG